MLKHLSALLLITLFSASAFAQHCPFDGAEMLVVELQDHKGERVFNASADITLHEISQFDATACKYKPGPLKLAFRSPIDTFLSRPWYNDSDVFRRYCADCAFDRDGYYAVMLSQGESSCAFPDKEAGQIWLKRRYEIRYERDGVAQTLRVEPENIYSLCTGNGPWARIKPVVLKLNDPKDKATAE